MISISSPVITACRVLLKVILNLSIISRVSSRTYRFLPCTAPRLPTKCPDKSPRSKTSSSRPGRADASQVSVKKNKNGCTKFKVRCSRFLYTLNVASEEKAKKLRGTLPPAVQVKEINVAKK